MKKSLKSLLLLGSMGFVGLTLASCGRSTRNTQTPYASTYNNNDITVATATNNKGEEFKMSLAQFYSRLRYSGYNTVVQSIKGQMYKDELEAIKELIAKEDLSTVSDKTKQLLTLSKDGKNLYDLSETTLDYSKKLNNYSYIRKQVVTTLTESLSSLVFSSSSADTIKSYTDEERETYINKFIESRARVGVNVSKSDLEFSYPEDDSTETSITFKNFKSLVENKEELFKTYLINQAEKLAGANALYQIANEEYVYPYDADQSKDEKTKNSEYYLFDKDSLKSAYNSSIKTYGTHKAIVVMYNSRSEALNATAKIANTLGYTLKDDLTDAQVKTFYEELYKDAYKYKDTTNLDEDFTFNVNETKNELEDLTSQAQTAITETLKDGEYLTEARNLNNKYYLIYHISSTYNSSSANEAKDYEDLSEDELNKYNTILKYEAIMKNASGYTTTLYKENLYKNMNNDSEEDDLRIYDPVMEAKYYNSYSDIYNLIKADNFKEDVIYSYNGYEYKVEDFYKDASKTYGNNILTNYFQLEYVNQFADEYVDSDTKESNEKTLSDDISTFEKGNNSNYSADFGVNNYLLAQYGYETKEDVLKYYYTASACLSSYTSKSVFQSFAQYSEQKTEENGSKSYVISESARDSFLKNLLFTGNKNYSKLFNIELDHFLINIDADGDGSPDDPDTFTKKFTAEQKENFENAVVDLARALYQETISGKYGSNTYYDILKHIKKAFEQGSELKTPYTSISGDTYTTWNDFKKYNFLVTVEELSSSDPITQTSVSNFVVPFKEYVEKVYENISADNVKMEDYKNGLFYIYNKETKDGEKITEASDATKITKDTLCKTVFGYHLLLVLDYYGPDSTKYEKKNDTDYQLNLAIILKEDEEDSANNIVVYTDSLNSESDKASFNQFFVYYIQKQNNQTSSLTSDISELMASLFDEVITTYTSNNFQTYLLLKSLNIQIVNNDYAIKVKTFDTTDGLDVEYFANQVVNYDEDSIYQEWIDGTYRWVRPEDKVSE